ncbi:LacI family DNA-binding transcriptional regulator [Listeria aquatica]|uniref:LacI family DNA-binding transcriptional regulator n=1 Tax=Listeria aquatica TaxID=1494960 RepID=UPI003F70331E
MASTIKDVAKEAGVSIATVSMVINHKADHITMKTKKKVFDAIAKLDYKPNLTARSLVSAKSFTVGLLVPDITNPFFAELAKAFEKELSKEGYMTLLCSSFEESEREKQYLSELISRGVDGVVICSLTSMETQILDALKQAKIPYLILDNRYSLEQFSVHVDDYKGGVLAASELLANGHRTTAFIGSKTPYVNIANRLQGFQNEIERAGGAVLTFKTDLTRSGGETISEELFSSEATAVFCSNDLIAVGLYDAANKRNLALPDELSVIGFDDISFSDIVKPRLTTIKQPVQLLAEKAVQHLLLMKKDPDYHFYKELIPVSLVKRESVTKRAHM